MARPGASNVRSADAKANVANYFCAETPFQLSQDVDLRNLLEFVMQGRLEQTDIKNAFSQDERRRMGRDKNADNLSQGIDDFCFLKTILHDALLLSQLCDHCTPLAVILAGT